MTIIRDLESEGIPVTVAVNSEGNSVQQTGPAKWHAPIGQNLLQVA